MKRAAIPGPRTGGPGIKVLLFRPSCQMCRVVQQYDHRRCDAGQHGRPCQADCWQNT